MQPDNAAGPVCRHLRSKHYYMDLDYHPSGLDQGVELPCWCLKTQQLFGPDSEIASHFCPMDLEAGRFVIAAEEYKRSVALRGLVGAGKMKRCSTPER